MNARVRVPLLGHILLILGLIACAVLIFLLRKSPGWQIALTLIMVALPFIIAVIFAKIDRIDDVQSSNREHR